MSTKLGNLGTALSEDFKQITGGLSMIAEAPGIKSLVAIVTRYRYLLGSLVLLILKIWTIRILNVSMNDG